MPNVTITINVSGAGSVTGTDDYNTGDPVIIRALPEADWLFDAWSGTDVGLLLDFNNEVTSFIMPEDDDVSLIANFLQDEVQDVLKYNIYFQQNIENVAPMTQHYSIIDEILKERAGDILINDNQHHDVPGDCFKGPF